METQLLQTPFGQFWGFKDEKTLRGLGSLETLEDAFPGISEEFLRLGDICLDIGANIGLFSLLVAPLVGSQGRVFAFEPCPETRELLHKNLQANFESGRVIVQPDVVSDGIYSHFMKIAPKNMGMTRFKEIEGESDDLFKSTTLDLWIQDHFEIIQHCNFIKIDVEGMEMKVLRGAVKLLAQDLPILYIEVCQPHYLKYGFTITELEEFLQEYGYHFFRFFNPFPYRNNAFRRLFSLNQGSSFYNLLAIHPSHPCYPKQYSKQYQAFFYMIAEKLENVNNQLRKTVQLRTRLKSLIESQ